MTKYSLSVIFALICLVPFSQTIQSTIIHDDIEREYSVRLPDGYTDFVTYPAVIMLHGLGGTNFDMLLGTGMNNVADDPNHPFIIIAPNALYQAEFDATEWSEGINFLSEIDDVGFISDMIDQVLLDYSIFEERIYCTGMSDGGFMTNRLACELNHKIAAFASVTGTMGNFFDCIPNDPVPLFHIHGTADQVVGYNGDILLGDPQGAFLYQSVDEIIDFWTSNANCDATPEEAMIGSDTEFFKYSPCDEGLEIWLFKVNGGNHNWNISSSFNTNEKIWEFFEPYELIVNLEETTENSEFNLYPNPSNGTVQIETNLKGQLDINIYNTSSQLVYTGTQFSGDRTLNFRGLPSGLYFVQVSNSNKRFSTSIIIE